MVLSSESSCFGRCLAVYVVIASQALGDVAFTSMHVMDLADATEGFSSVGAVTLADKCPVGRGSEEKRGRQEYETSL